MIKSKCTDDDVKGTIYGTQEIGSMKVNGPKSKWDYSGIINNHRCQRTDWAYNHNRMVLEKTEFTVLFLKPDLSPDQNIKISMLTFTGWKGPTSKCSVVLNGGIKVDTFNCVSEDKGRTTTDFIVKCSELRDAENELTLRFLSGVAVIFLNNFKIEVV
jgi:hypothetical protein